MHKVITPARVRSQGCRSGEQQVVGPAGGAGEEGCLKAGADTLGSVSKSSLAPVGSSTAEVNRAGEVAGDQLLRDDVDLSGITQLLQQMLAVLPRQPEGTHISDPQARDHVEDGGKMLALELPVHHPGFRPRDQILKRQLML